MSSGTGSVQTSIRSYAMNIMRRTRRPAVRKSTFKDANSPIPASAKSLIRNLADYLEGDTFAVSYLKSEYLSKYNSASEGVSASDRRAAAIEKWRFVDERNGEFSRTFDERDPGWNILPRVTFSRFLSIARRLVADVLGELRDVIVVGSFSGGASTSRSRAVSHKADKFVGMADITESAMCFVDVIHREMPLLKRYGSFYYLHEVEGAVLFTVPKNAEIDRCACKEPDVNMFLQKGVGRHIRRRLLRVGQNLNDQTINRAFARSGSLSGDLATIDLSSASDTICTSVVRQLLPSDWFEYLNSIRSSAVWVDGELIRTNMFSSMGNGFTFELESLIFWALMKTTSYFRGTVGSISVYGDDIIVPSSDYDMYLWVLKSFGFYPNESKSFGTGPFRESCGGHYYLGQDVTPFYLRRPPERLTDLIRLANRLRGWIFSDPGREHVVPSAVKLWLALRDYVPLKLWGGHDYALDTLLVSPSFGGQRLVRVSTPKKVNELGRYLAWHCDAWSRSHGLEEPSHAPTATNQRCRMRRSSRAFSSVDEFLLCELVAIDPE
nr:MAG: RNA-dependent RNA polymerase [Hangzhou fiers-like virus 6]